MPEADALKRIEAGLSQQRRAQRQADFVDSLRAKAGVQVLLPAPRLAVDVAGNPSRGPVDAPVTIVEFSDFQCPYCSRAIETLKKVEENYAGKVRLVYRDYPLVQIHPDAARAAEAATCANDQGKFWADARRPLRAPGQAGGAGPHEDGGRPGPRPRRLRAVPGFGPPCRGVEEGRRRRRALRRVFDARLLHQRPPRRGRAAVRGLRPRDRRGAGPRRASPLAPRRTPLTQ